jgi:hypothetical protein
VTRPSICSATAASSTCSRRRRTTSIARCVCCLSSRHAPAHARPQYQLAKGGGANSYSDQPSAADVVSLQLRHGDVVALATDGFTDNVFLAELEKLLELVPSSEDLQAFAVASCEYARLCGFKRKRRSPFEVEAARHGVHAPGGKSGARARR